MGLAAVVVIVAGVRAAQPILVPFLLSAFLAFLLGPPLFWLQARGMSPVLAFLTVLLGLLVLGAFLVGLIGSAIEDFSRALPGVQERLSQEILIHEPLLERLGIDSQQALDGTSLDAGAAMRLAGRFASGLGGLLSNAFLIFVTTSFLLFEATSFPTKLRLISGDATGTTERTAEIVEAVRSYLVIKSLTSIATAVGVFLLLTALGVRFAVVWAMLAFLLNFVPAIGSILAAVPPVLLALVDQGIGTASLATLGYLIVNLGMSNVVEPRFMGRGVGLSPLIVFLSMIFWGWVLGPVGMLLAVPLTVIARIVLGAREESRWIAIILGPALDPAPGKKT
jgi:predicted PurR-regulated permease PerM